MRIRKMLRCANCNIFKVSGLQLKVETLRRLIIQMSEINSIKGEKYDCINEAFEKLKICFKYDALNYLTDKEIEELLILATGKRLSNVVQLLMS